MYDILPRFSFVLGGRRWMDCFLAQRWWRSSWTSCETTSCGSSCSSASAPLPSPSEPWLPASRTGCTALMVASACIVGFFCGSCVCAYVRPFQRLEKSIKRQDRVTVHHAHTSSLLTYRPLRHIHVQQPVHGAL